MRTTICIALLILIAGTSPARAQAAAPAKPNVIYIIVDDLGYGDVGAFGQNQRPASEPHLVTPNLDRMAAEGMRLTDHYCSAPVCAPSRASLLTGLDQGHCNVRDNQFDKPIPADHTLGTVMKQAGYYTAAIGKWGVGGPNPPWPGHALNRGFDEYYGFMKHGAAHDHYAGNNGAIFDGFNPVKEGIDGAYDTDLFTARAKRTIRQHVERRKGQPFFLYLAYTLPHFKMQLPPGPYPEGRGLKGGIQWPLKLDGKPDSYVYPEFQGKTWPDNEVRFACMIHRLDDCVGDVIQLVRDLGIDHNTLIVFTSDNGPHNEGNDPRFFDSWGKFDGFKRDVLEGGGRVPTIAWWPGSVPAQQTCAEPSVHYDWMATLAELAGVPSPASTDGVSLAPSLLGKPQQQRHHPYLYFEYKGTMTGPLAKDVVKRKGYRVRGEEQAVRIGDFVGLRYDIQSPGDPLKLFNVAKDPHQDHNLAQDAKYGALLERMTALLVTARTPDADAKRPYDAERLPAVAAPAHTGAVAYHWFDGRWPWLPDFRAMTPQRSGNQAGLSLPDAKGAEAFGVEFLGYVRVPTDGQYAFTSQSDSGTVLWVHDSLVINDDATHDGKVRSGSVELRAGWHPIRLAYRHNPGKSKPSLNVTLRGPDASKDEPIAVDALGRSEAH